MSLLIVVLVLLMLGLISAVLPSYAAARFRNQGDSIIDNIDALLPQTQCGQCGHAGCRPYAEAIAQGEAINHCPPGGEDTIHALARLLAVDFIPLDETHGTTPERPKVAYIREAECIGCTKCIQACPVDAILGAAKLMHTVITDECTGCDLCVEPCPVDCIDMLDAPINQGNSHKRIPMQEMAGSNQNEHPCIRCGACAEVCPAHLLPQQLYWYSKAKDFEKTQQYYLADCVECGACEEVCPSKIPLVNYFRFAKDETLKKNASLEKSDLSRTRFETRNVRIEKEKTEKENKRLAKMEQRKFKPVQAESNVQANNDALEIAFQLAKTTAAKANKQFREAEKALAYAHSRSQNESDLAALAHTVENLKIKSEQAQAAFKDLQNQQAQAKAEHL